MNVKKTKGREIGRNGLRSVIYRRFSYRHLRDRIQAIGPLMGRLTAKAGPSIR
jgi:hypothetical protein